MQGSQQQQATMCAHMHAQHVACGQPAGRRTMLLHKQSCA